MLEALGDHDDVTPLSPHMMHDMEADAVPERDLDSFIASLSEAELRDLRELVDVQEAVTSDAAPGSETEPSSRE